MVVIFAIVVSIFAIIFALLGRQKIKKEPQGSEEMKEIAAAIYEGSLAYLKRQYKAVAIAAFVIAVLLAYFFDFTTSAGFLVGAAASAMAGYLGMLTSVISNSRVAEKAKKGLPSAFRLAFKGGLVTGLLVVGLGLFVLAIVWLLTESIMPLISLGFGGSLISVFSRLGGGIYTKGADVGADLIGKIEVGIPEDDPRNPAVIADNVGDNVGDCAGMAADLFETYVVTMVAAVLLGSLLFPASSAIILYPLLLGSLAIIGSILGAFFVRLKGGESIMRGLYKGLVAAGIISAALFLPATYLFVKPNPGSFLFLGGIIQPLVGNWLNLYIASLIGLITTFLIFLITDYYTSKRKRPVESIARASTSGHATNIITGLAVSMESTAMPIVVVALAIIFSWLLFGIYGIAIAAVSMLSLAGIIVAIDSFGPITDNAGGIAEMAHLPEEIRNVTDPLDAVGNTTKAVTKGYAIASAGLAALVLFSSYAKEVAGFGQNITFELQDPLVLVGIFLGAMLPYLFASLAMLAVGKTATSIINEVRRQFREIKGIMDGTEKPNYARAVDIVTKSALKQMTLPAVLPILITIVVAIVFGPKALGGLLIGVIVTGLFVAISMTSGGAAWDNAKKYIEEGNYGGKGSLAHQAAITGDTVGDPYKDTAGPAINPMIKVVNIVALLLVGLLF